MARRWSGGVMAVVKFERKVENGAIYTGRIVDLNTGSTIVYPELHLQRVGDFQSPEAYDAAARLAIVRNATATMQPKRSGLAVIVSRSARGELR